MKSNKPDFSFHHPHSPYVGNVDFYFEDMWMQEDDDGEISWYKLFDVGGMIGRTTDPYNDPFEFNARAQFKYGGSLEIEGLEELQKAYDWIVEHNLTTVIK